MNKQFIVGLTGGIASGKSAATEFFEQQGICVVDADLVARQVVEPGSHCLEAIAKKFGLDAVNEQGGLNRTYLREQVFNNDTLKSWLNELLHPAIREAMRTQTKQATSPYIIWAVPLLIENNIHKTVDKVLVIDALPQDQIKRATKRDNCSEFLIKSIMAAQASRDERRQHADDIVLNDGDISQLHEELEALHKNYLTLALKKR